MQTQSSIVIAIDGPAASGKSSVARKLARRLGYEHINSGAFYRAITWFLLEKNLLDTAEQDDEQISQVLAATRMSCSIQSGNFLVAIDGHALDDELHSDEVNANVSRVAAMPVVRNYLLAPLRSYAQKHNIIMEGRDIGSVVFPDSSYKFYLDASPEIRSQRRSAQGQEDSILNRDKLDSSRKAAPLIVADDAVTVDSSHLSIDGVVDKIIEHLRAKGLRIDT
ncbi:MAG: (d)CMP kinase [Chthoniobacterales bacterium]